MGLDEKVIFFGLWVAMTIVCPSSFRGSTCGEEPTIKGLVDYEEFCGQESSSLSNF
jgi:hypothetical protein